MNKGNTRKPESGGEPERLRDGKAFHRKVQEDWVRTAEGEPEPERPCVKPSGRAGRIDIHVDVDAGLVAVVEVKHSDWDRMTPAAVRRNVKRQARQLWSYIDSQMQGLGQDHPREVCPGIIFPQRPTDPDRMRLIEELFESEGIPVVWEDETIQQRRAR